MGFNPHTHEGCDPLIKSMYRSSLVFQSTHPRRVWLDIKSNLFRDITFQSTHPRRVWLNAIGINFRLMWFQSTHPRRVWRDSFTCLPRKRLSFNPHTHEGCDFQTLQRFQVVSVFQSTHPRRVWRNNPYNVVVDKRVSIHTPTKGVTVLCSMVLVPYMSFNPHTHEGCDASWKMETAPRASFNPHTHEGCDCIFCK